MYFLHFHTKGVYATKMSQPPLQKCGKGLNFEAQNLSLGASIFDEMNDAKHQPKVGLTSKWCKTDTVVADIRYMQYCQPPSLLLSRLSYLFKRYSVHMLLKIMRTCVEYKCLSASIFDRRLIANMHFSC